MENKLHTKQTESNITTVVQDTVQKMTTKVKNLTNDVADFMDATSKTVERVTTLVENTTDTDTPKDTEDIVVDDTFINRELSWLDFNERVISQYDRTDMCYMDRLTFLGIASSNLDEFISVRFAGLYHTKETTENSVDAFLYRKVLSRIKEQREKINLYLNKNVPTEVPNDIVRYGDPRFNVTNKMRHYFTNEIFPILTPISLGTNKEVPKFNDNDVNFFIKLKPMSEETKSNYCFLQVPHQIPRVVKLGKVYYFVDDIIQAFFADIFNNADIEDYIEFKVTKEYDTEIENDDNISIIDRVNTVLVKREENNIVFIDVMGVTTESDSSSMVKKLTKLLNVDKRHVYKTEQRIGSLRALANQYLKDKPFKKISINSVIEHVPFKPILPTELENEKSIFDYLDDDDLILHHPYHSYDAVVGFIREAANDPKVISIKQTLYRVSSEKSPIIRALCDAAMSGKKVTVMLELLARFDERQNINLINTLNQAGCNIVYSLEGLKTHCKMCIVTKSTKKGIVTYSHVGTGNYNEKTAHIYTDISYLTSNKAIGHDLTSIFNMITGFSKPSELKRVKYSPITLRSTLVEEMGRCCTESTEELPSNITIKINSFSDVEMVNTIEQLIEKYPTVQWLFIVRGICSLPKLERYTNVTIKSIVGRFLEHSRIYSFESKGKSRVYISSADMLTRNLDKRIEILCPISDKESKAKLVNILDTMAKDTVNSWVMEGTSFKRVVSDDEFNSHSAFITNTR